MRRPCASQYLEGSYLDAAPEMRDTFWSILSENSVFAYFCGHSHRMSHIAKDGVWQVDAGEVRGSHLCVTLVMVDGETVVVRSYKTSGTVPVSELENPDANDLVFESVITPLDAPGPETDIQYLYGAAPAAAGSGDGTGSCFVNALK